MSERDPFELEMEAALGRLETPRARAEFKQRLREQFQEGRFDTAAGAVPTPARSGRRRGWGTAITMLAASVALIFLLRSREAAVDPGPAVGLGDARPQVAWTVTDAMGSLRVNGTEYSAGDLALNDAIAQAAMIETGEYPLTLRRGDAMLLEAAPDTHFVLAMANDEIEATRGVLRVCTGPAFEGLSMQTPDIRLAVTGTAFAVDILEMGTCVCCTEGTVSVDPLDMPCEHAVEIDGRAFAFRDRTQPCEIGDAMVEHVTPLDALVDLAESLWGPR